MVLGTNISFEPDNINILLYHVVIRWQTRQSTDEIVHYQQAIIPVNKPFFPFFQTVFLGLF
jgi:hypothetical protein